jgi:4'-phosphopantetheinyl transferase
MQVDVWYVRTAEAADEGLLGEYRGLLSDQERQLEQRFRPPELRLTHVVTRALARTVLAEYTQAPPQQLQFEFGPHGKPSLRWPVIPGLSFNLSHSAGAVVCAVSRGGDIGIDIERCDRRVNLALADRYFAAAELADLRRLEAHQQSRRFLEFWTLKEAFIKSLGTGLATSLSSFAFQSGRSVPQVTLYDASLGTSDDWSFAQFVLDDAYYGAVAVRGPQIDALQLRIERCLPLRLRGADDGTPS